MARNIEIKAKVDSLVDLEKKVASLATEGPIEIAQDDTFFRCDTGRLKLRAFSATAGELIFYQRSNQQGPKESFYVTTPSADPASLRQVLSLAYGEVGRVIKARTLYLVGRTRVHLDRVQGLGDFMELEVVLQDHEAPEAGAQEAHALMAQLGVRPCDLIEGAYVDLFLSSR